MRPERDTPWVVLVEDDDVDAIAVQRGLKRLGAAHRMHRLVDGEAALAFLRSAPSPRQVPMVLLVDINMPRMSGIEMLRELRKDASYDDVDVFMLTTSNLAADVSAARELRVSGYITKDAADEAYRRVAQALNRAAGLHPGVGHGPP